jgi:hypothetical protein
MGATLLLPISIGSNEVLLIYPKTYYVQWLNGMLIQGLWNLIFLFANISLFILLPFAYLFIESEGFSGHKKGVIAKVQEAMVALVLVGFSVWGIAYMFAAVLSPERFALGGLLSLSFIHQLPFIYSCISFFGVLLLLMCTPLGLGHIFTVLSQLMVGPQFLRNVDEEFLAKQMEIESLKKILNTKANSEKSEFTSPMKYFNQEDPIAQNGNQPAQALKGGSSEFNRKLNRMRVVLSEDDDSNDSEGEIRGSLVVMEAELLDLEKLKKTSGWKRNLFYPLSFILVFALTSFTVLKVILNTLLLLVGTKALPLSAQTISLGLSSMSILGPWGAALEIGLIFYLISTSLVGLYNLPIIRRVRPRLGDTPTSHIICNCALVLILSSALPLLACILGITNFDLLGNYGQIEWLGNIYIVLMYNVLFSISSTLCLVNKFTSPIRQELVKRLRSVCLQLKGYLFGPSRSSDHRSHKDLHDVLKED